MPMFSEMEHDSAVLFAEGVPVKEIGLSFGYANPYKVVWAHLNSVRLKLGLFDMSLDELQQELSRRGWQNRPYYFSHNGEDGPECNLCTRRQSKQNRIIIEEV